MAQLVNESLESYQFSAEVQEFGAEAGELIAEAIIQDHKDREKLDEAVAMLALSTVLLPHNPATDISLASAFKACSSHILLTSPLCYKYTTMCVYVNNRLRTYLSTLPAYP